jgi:hypothetical protein
VSLPHDIRNCGGAGGGGGGGGSVAAACRGGGGGNGVGGKEGEEEEPPDGVKQPSLHASPNGHAYGEIAATRVPVDAKSGLFNCTDGGDAFLSSQSSDPWYLLCLNL